MNVTTNGLLFAPILRFVAPNFLRWNQYVKSVNTMMELIQESIAKHKETFDSTNLRYVLPLKHKNHRLSSYYYQTSILNNSRDYIDHHLFEIGNEIDPTSSFYKDAGSKHMHQTLKKILLIIFLLCIFTLKHNFPNRCQLGCWNFRLIFCGI